MFDTILSLINDRTLLVSVLATIAAIATVVTLGMPLLVSDDLSRRMKTVAVERSQIRAREREKATTRGEAPSLRQAPKAYMKRIVEQLDLTRWLGTEDAREKLIKAGYRAQSAMVTFLFFRMVSPVALFLFALFYVFVVLDLPYPPIVRFGMCIAAAYVGIKAPELFISNLIAKRQLSIRRSWPDALDLMLICCESGMSIEHAFRKVSVEMSSASIPLAEELALTTAELSYLPDRRQAYENLAKRTGLEGVKSVTTALIQAERYGTPLGAALRVLAQENRDMRMMEAEKKAAALPPKLTVPMIVFFLPVLFVVIMGPALIQVFKWD
jgi:tight adherence protein C